MAFRHGLAIGLLLVALGSPLWGETVKFAYAQYYPANYQDESGEHRGFFIEILKELFERRLGFKLETDTLPWIRCQLLLQQGLVDLIATIPTPERLSYAVAVEPPIWVKKYRVYTFAENGSLATIGSIRGVDALKASRLRVISYLGNNWSETTLKDRGIEVIDAANVESMYQMLAARRGDIIVEDPLLAAPVLSRLNLLTKVILTQGMIDESRFHILVGKKSVCAGRSLEIGKELEKMYRDGTVERIMAPYR